MERDSDDRNSSSGDVSGVGDAAAAKWYAERDVALLVSLELESSSAIWSGLVDRVSERDDWMWPSAWAGTCGLLRLIIFGVRLG